MMIKYILWSMENVRVHVQTHATSTDISTSCVLNGVGVCVSLRNCFVLK